jgi:thiamine-phosphate diphosphorylase
VEVIDAKVLRLVAITDDLRDGSSGLVARAMAAVRGGSSMVQLRLKDASARELVEVARLLVAELAVPVIVNDRMDVALAAGAAGVHLGADDLPVGAARAAAPEGFIIGSSAGNDTELARVAGADYVGIGPVFGSASKLDAGPAIGVDEFSRLAKRASMPAVAVGGITAENASGLFAGGAAGVAVIRAIFADSDPEDAARRLAAAIGT